MEKCLEEGNMNVERMERNETTVEALKSGRSRKTAAN